MKTTTPTTAAATARITYDIERHDTDAYGQGRWHGDIGESRGWLTTEAAEYAVESLRQLGAAWLGDYRIVESASRRVVRQMILGETMSASWAHLGAQP